METSLEEKTYFDVEKELFSKFPIQVGIARKKVYDYIQLNEYVRQEKADCFASVFYREGNNILLDKMFFDIDSRNLNLAYQETLELVSRLKEYGTTLHMFTGKKGFHVYLLLNPIYLHMDEAKSVLETVFAFFIKDLKWIDTRVTPDTNRLCRIPNTTREGGVCTMLPQTLPKRLFDLNGYLGKFNQFSYSVERKYNIKELYDFFKDDIQENDVSLVISGERDVRLNDNAKATNFLKRILRPCVFDSINCEEASHEARTAAAIELMRCGLSVISATEMLEMLAWNDFDFRKTTYHLMKIKQSNFEPYSCKKMKNYCIGEEDCWFMKERKGEQVNE